MKKLVLLILASAALAMASCGDKGEKKPVKKLVDQKDKDVHAQALTFFGQVKDTTIADTALVSLGRKLYMDPALSVNDKISCNSCHLLDKFGVDNLPTSPGHAGVNGERNSPTVYNSRYNFVQFWDGRAKNLAEQAKAPVLNPVEMGMPSEAALVKKLEALPEYMDAFKKVFSTDAKPLSYQHIADAIAAFELTLNTPAKFDTYLGGDLYALSPEEREGLDLFISKGCIACHIGPNLGGTMYQKFGLVKEPYWDYTHSAKQDKGRSVISKNAADDYFFKVPGLRNVAMTAPYFHDGSVADLKEAVKIMAITQNGVELTDAEASKMVEFLKALTGESKP